MNTVSDVFTDFNQEQDILNKIKQTQQLIWIVNVDFGGPTP